MRMKVFEGQDYTEKPISLQFTYLNLKMIGKV